MLKIELEPYEYQRAAQIGIERAERYASVPAMGYRAEEQQRQHASAGWNDVETANVLAAVLELAYAKALGEYWHGHGGHFDYNKVYRWRPDVGDNIEVRRVINANAGPVLKQTDMQAAISMKARHGLPLFVASGHVVDNTAFLHGMAPMLEVNDLECCRHYTNGSVRICQKHLRRLT